MEIPGLHCAQELSKNFRQPSLQPVLLGFVGALSFLSCSTQPAPLSITLEHPQTKHSLTCSAKDQLGRTDTSLLAGTVENCARGLEQRGYVRKR